MLRPATMLCMTLAAGPSFGQTVEHYDGLCDASAAVALDVRHFVVASDEDDTLRIFERGQPPARATLPLRAFLRSGKQEADLEAATRIGKRIYWIGSLSRDAKGRPAPQRDRLFATNIDDGSSPPTLRPVGAGPVPLRDALAASEAGRQWQLAEAARHAPEAPEGLNVEGLTHTADGSLLIGLRNPLRDGKALFAWPGTPQRQLLSDDGGIDVRGAPCKTLAAAEQRFLSLQFSR